MNITQEVYALNQRIGADRQRAFFRDVEQRAIVTDALFDITARAGYTIEIARDEFKFATCHGFIAGSKEKRPEILGFG